MLDLAGAAAVPTPSQARRKGRSQGVVRAASILICMLLAVIGFQLLAGAYTADIADYDESAHYVTGLMVRECIASFDWLRPLQFAQTYYDRYPRVAIGHWPPGFYLAQAAWTLPFSASRASIILFMAVQSAFACFLAFVFWRPELGLTGALAAALLFAQTPVIRMLMAQVMADIPALVWMMAALIAFRLYLDSERWRHSALFGLLASAAIMTKANGLALALVPPIAILVCGKAYLVRRWSFWIPALIVAVICAPWYIATFRMAQDGRARPAQPFFLRELQRRISEVSQRNSES